jgi:hypothetical protein
MESLRQFARFLTNCCAPPGENGPSTALPEKSRIAFQVRMSLAAFVIRRNWVDGHVVLARRFENPRFRHIETFSPKCPHGWAEAHQVGQRRHLA